MAKFASKDSKHLIYAYFIINAVILVFSIFCFLYLFSQKNTFDGFQSTINQELIRIAEYKKSISALTDDFNSAAFNLLENSDKQKHQHEEKLISSARAIKEIEEKSSISEIHFIENINGLLADYENLLKENSLLSEYLIQLGTPETGIYSKMMLSVADFKHKIQFAPSQIQAIKSIDEVLLSIQLLQFADDEAYFYNLQSKIDGIFNQLNQMSPDSSNFMVTRVSDALQDVKQAFLEYSRKRFEIGVGQNSGLVEKINARLAKIEFRLNDSLSIVHRSQFKNNRFAITILVFLILLLLAFNFTSLYFMAKRQKLAATSISEYIKSLENGSVYRFNKEFIPFEIHQLIDELENFAVKFGNVYRVFNSILAGNHSLEIKRDTNFEHFREFFTKLKDKLSNLNQQIADEKKIQSEMIWIKAGIDKLTEVMRREYDNPLLHANEIINMLVDYLKIPIGAIYLVKEENGIKYAELASAFAFGKEKQLYNKIAFGEGIVGTSATERKTINVSNVPDNYFNIVSGFGETKPRNIIASPIKLNEEIYGVIELASLQRFKDEEIKFIEEVCKTVAYSFAISKVYLDTMTLFENSNLQISELEAEKDSLLNEYEDMNQNYKKLEIESSDNEFIVTKLNDIAIRVTLDLDGNILEVNPRFEMLFKADRKKFIQSNYRDYMSDAKFVEDVDFDFFWKDIRIGLQHEIELGLTIANQEYWLKQYFFPVKDEMGRVKKIQMIAFDITDKIKLQQEIDSLKSSK